VTATCERSEFSQLKEESMGLTTDPEEARNSPIDPETGMQETYVVLSDEERAKGFVRPVRTSYLHDRCGKVTTMGLPIAETYARDPYYYGGTYCGVGPQGEFTWVDRGQDTGIKVGT
jgi:hypothetical protein